ncbi:putative Furin [Hyella patelloides LEGE 07179]|uniref:Putative Furin n=1 Tax=Hyella patelloides LEGE 07179 TaxID=945734 RepID=A0A563W229_9CYAN|nr:S8 family peptidase [Hyella patelloides]VEP17726.1 putative Furin [Hyella patelloides LEGE 07179]
MTTSDFDITTIGDRDPLFDLQWYLQNTGQTGGTPEADANIVDAWSTATGEGVVIGIVDDGVQYTHSDLNDNYNSALSYDFQSDDSDPFPLISENHGTRVAGIAVGEGNNDLGIIGAAPDATFASLRVDFSSAIEDYLALSYQNQDIDIYSNSWSMAENFVEPPQLAQDAIENNTEEGRGGLGNIYVFAAGNNALEEDNVNYDRYTNSRYTIAVGAIDRNGEHSNYSNPGASLLISAYSSNDDIGVVTTDNGTIINPDSYTEDFGGTSAATPLVSGVIALMLEANPNLTWRDVQHILVETAEKNDPNDLDWVQNGAGHDVNYKYGFGGIDATAAVNSALNWESVAEEVSLTSEQINVNSLIPDNNPVGISSSFNIEEDIDVEWVEVVFDAEHTWRGDLEIVLTSPDGTQSVLAEFRDDDGYNYDNWMFTSACHWGESSQGEWTLTVSDNKNLISGTWNSWEINLYGTANEPVDSPPTVVTPIADLTVTEDDANQTIDLSDVFQDADGDEITIAVGANSNDRLVSTTIEDDSLTLDFAENQSGTAEITLRATANEQTVDDTFTVTVEPEEVSEPIDLFRFHNTTYETGTYIFVNAEERDAIISDSELREIFALDGISPAFTASLVDGDDLAPVYRIRSLETPGTYAFVGQQERDAIFADPNLREIYEAEGLDSEGNDVADFYLHPADAGLGTEINRFQNTQNGTFLYASPAETEAIINDPNLSSIFTNQGVAFNSLE